MKRFIVALLALPALAAAASEPLVVTRAALWTEQGIVSDCEIIIRDGRVADVGQSGALDRPAGAKVIDAEGDTLLPGLIDSHVHLVLGARVPAEFKPADVSAATAKQLLRSGVTSGRIHLWDLPNAAQWKKDAATDAFPSPRLVIGGPALFGGQPTWDSPTGNVWGVKGIDDAVAKVRRLKEAGADWVGLHGLGRFQPGELDAIVAEARRLNLKLLVGGDSIAEIERAVAIGADSTEYLDMTATPRYPDDLIAQIKARGTSLYCVPPIGYKHRFMAWRRGELSFDAPELTEFLPEAVAAYVRQALSEDRTKTDSNATKNETAFPTLDDKFRQLHQAGIQLVVGTDCGSPANLQADAIWWELETWRQLGVAPHDIIRAATVLPARMLGQTDIGHLGIGARGDFVLYRGSVTRGPFTVANVRAVAKGGVLFVDQGKWIAHD